MDHGSKCSTGDTDPINLCKASSNSLLLGGISLFMNDLRHKCRSLATQITND